MGQEIGTTSKSIITNEQIKLEVTGRESFHLTDTRQELGAVKPPRLYHRVSGNKGPKWDIPNCDIETVSHAILERVYFVKDGKGKFKRPPKPWTHASVISLPNPKRAAQEKFDRRLQTFSRAMHKVAARTGQTPPISSDEFLMLYSGAKLACYTKAVESLQNKPLEERDCRVKVFTKDEYRKPGGAPRAIQPRSPRFNVQLGRHLKHLEHNIYEAIDEVFDPTGDHKTVAKGMNMVQRGNEIEKMWNMHDDPVAVGLDASRFDQHINTMWLEFEQKIFQMFAVGHGDDIPNLSTLLRELKRNKGSYRNSDGRIAYTVTGCRMSGDMITSVGNVVDMCSDMFAYIEARGLSGKVSLLNDGDDCVIIMSRKHLKQFMGNLKDWFLEMGITMEYDGIYRSLEEIEFCQSRPVWSDEHGYRMMPRPSKRLYSDLVSTKDLSVKKVYEAQVGAIAGCGLAGTGGSPIYQSFYKWLGRGATPWIPEQGSCYYKFRQELVDNLTSKTREPSDKERTSFFLAFDISPVEQRLLEEYYDALPDPIHSPAQRDLIRDLDTIQYLNYPEQKD